MGIAIFYLDKNIYTQQEGKQPLPIIPTSDLDNCFLNNPLIKKPTNGKKGISQAICKTLFILPQPLKEDFICPKSLKGL